MLSLLSTEGFMPHGMCLLWKPLYLWGLVLSNGLTALSYFLIPMVLVFIVLKRKDFKFNGLFLLFGAFIVLCGFTHVIDIITYWHPIYPVQVIVESLTGLVSFLTFINLCRLIPQILTILTPEQIIAKERQLNKAKTQASAKSMFLSNMSHEIRTPMNAIMGFAEVLSETRLTNEQQEYIDTIKSSSKSLLAIIDDILDLAKLEEGKVTIENIELDLNGLVQEVLNVFDFKAKEKGINLIFEKPNRPLFSYYGDPVRLRQILINLIGNAIKFTSVGFVKLKLSLHPENKCLRLHVSDSGCGIPKEKINKIFQPFTQADDSTTRHYGGTGLGTTICKNLVNLMNGKIWLESQVDVGTTVFVELPISSNDTVLIDDEIPTPIKSTDGLKANLTALIVDDVPHNLKLLEIQLKKTNFTPIKAENGQEAVDIYTKNPNINLILMDIQMPVMDGLQAIQLIRELEKNSRSHVPIVALSASVIEHEQQRCVDAGADLFIAKPVNFDKLIKAIKKIIPDTTYQQALEFGLKPLSTFETIVLDEEASKDEHIDFHGSLDKLEEKLRSNLLEDSLRCLKSLKSTLPQECYNRIMADLSNFNFKSALQTLKTLQKK